METLRLDRRATSDDRQTLDHAAPFLVKVVDRGGSRLPLILRRDHVLE
jgi:hypothetical protein